MPLHLLKLCVGAESIGDLEAWIAESLAAKKARGLAVEQAHTTRMVPKRVEELLDGGSLYWVIKGQLSARQKLLDVRPFTDGEGVSRCHLVLEPVVMQLSRDFKGRLKVVEFDVATAPKTAARLRVTGTPTVVYFSKGREVERVVGYRAGHYHRALIEHELLTGAAPAAP